MALQAITLHRGYGLDFILMGFAKIDPLILQVGLVCCMAHLSVSYGLCLVFVHELAEN